MEYNQTEVTSFIETFRFFTEKLPHEIVKRAYISIGSHLFINFGDEFQKKASNGRLFKKSPWTIWLGANVNWRLSQNGKFIVGSSQPYDQMNLDVQKLVGKKYISSTIISSLMDIQFEFEGGYQLSSFFSVLINEQWTLFCENENTAGLEAETLDQVKQIQQLSNHFEIQNLFTDISLPVNQKHLKNFSLEGSDLHLDFEGALCLSLDRCDWRIENDDSYCIGSGDYELDEDINIDQYLKELVGKKLIKSSATKPFQDARFEFENGYVIKTFSSLKYSTPWRVLKNNKEIVYSAEVLLNNT